MLWIMPAPIWKQEDLPAENHAALVAAIVVALREAGVSVSRPALVALVRVGDAAEILQLLETAWQEGGAQALEVVLRDYLAPLIRVEVTQNAPDLPAEPLMETVRDALVVAGVATVTATTLEALRILVPQVLTSARSVTAQVEMLVQAVGLTPKQLAAVERYRAGLIQAGESSACVQQLVETRIIALKRQRAEAIVRTETVNAREMAQDAAWNAAAAAGQLDRTRFRRVWVLGPNPCPVICAPVPGMNPGGVPLGVPFQMPVGPRQTPTLHTRCECHVEAAR